MLPGHNAQGKMGPYDDHRHHGEIQLPEIQGSSKNYQNYESSSVGRPYVYKTNID